MKLVMILDVKCLAPEEFTSRQKGNSVSRKIQGLFCYSERVGINRLFPGTNGNKKVPRTFQGTFSSKKDSVFAYSTISLRTAVPFSPETFNR